MHKFVLVLIVLVVLDRVAAIHSNESLASCSYTDSCTSGGYTGACVSISAGCCSAGTQTSNLCPGLLIYSFMLFTYLLNLNYHTNLFYHSLTHSLTHSLSHLLPHTRLVGHQMLHPKCMFHAVRQRYLHANKQVQRQWRLVHRRVRLLTFI